MLSKLLDDDGRPRLRFGLSWTICCMPQTVRMESSGFNVMFIGNSSPRRRRLAEFLLSLLAVEREIRLKMAQSTRWSTSHVVTMGDSLVTPFGTIFYRLSSIQASKAGQCMTGLSPTEYQSLNWRRKRR